MKGHALQATVFKIQSKRFEKKIEKEQVYVTSNFRVAKPKSSFNAISAPCTITLTPRTKVVQTEVPHESIPKHYF